MVPQWATAYSKTNLTVTGHLCLSLDSSHMDKLSHTVNSISRMEVQQLSLMVNLANLVSYTTILLLASDALGSFSATLLLKL